MNARNPNSTLEPIAKARVEADKLVRLLSEELPSGDELKDRWYEVGRTIRPALDAIREMEGQAVAETSLCGIG